MCNVFLVQFPGEHVSDEFMCVSGFVFVLCFVCVLLS